MNAVERTSVREGDRAAARIAARQWGALSLAQAIAAGLSDDQITYRLKTGQWRRVAQKVYVLAGAPDRWEQKVMVACLAGPPDTVASHLTAAALFGLAKPPAPPHVTIKRGASGRSLCKKLVRPSRLIRASGEAWSATAGRRRGRLAVLERALDVWRCGLPADSPPEARLQRKLIEWGFPRAERQVVVNDEDGNFVARADVGIPELKVLFEYDSDEHHGPRCWIADDERKARLEALGWVVISIDRFDLRPSSTRLRDELEKTRLSRSTVTIPVERDSRSDVRHFAA